MVGGRGRRPQSPGAEVLHPKLALIRPGTLLAPLLLLSSVFHGAKADDAPSAPDRSAAYRRHGLDPASSLEARVKDTSSQVLDMFKELKGPPPRAHALTEGERLSLKKTIEALPPVHRRVLTERLRIISFLDGMPNTALTSTVNADEPYRLFDITINASILRQNVSEWLTQKERTCFDAAGSPLSVSIDAGSKLDALVYAFLHEATHVIDAAERITPVIARRGEALRPRIGLSAHSRLESGASSACRSLAFATRSGNALTSTPTAARSRSVKHRLCTRGCAVRRSSRCTVAETGSTTWPST